MNKWMKLCTAVVFSVLLLMGCSNDANNNNQEEPQNKENVTSQNESSNENQEDTVHITVSEDEGDTVHAEEDIDVEEGDILLDIMKDNFDIEEDGGFITAIEGVEQDEDAGKYWLFDVNGEMAEVGANDLELTPGDEVEFDLQVAE